MTDYKKINDLIHLAYRALVSCHYTRAEKLIIQIILEAQKAKDWTTFELAKKALTDCQRFHFLNVLRTLKQIDPIQAKRKELS
ncbi:hypothetical protein ES703_76569 [subsurface metagenome]